MNSSRSTAAYDRGRKFENYRQLPSLRHYLLVEQDRVGVEHRYRESGALTWESEVFSELDQAIVLGAIQCELKLADLYSRIELD